MNFIVKSGDVNIRWVHIPSRANLSRVQLFTLQNVIKSRVSPENEQTSVLDKRECRQQLVVTSVYHTMLRVGGGRPQDGCWPVLLSVSVKSRNRTHNSTRLTDFS